MSSSKKPQTIGYWYRPLIHFGLWQGPIDALLEFRGGDRTAWRGRLEVSDEFYVDALNLWGGESSEGGIAGYCDFMNGDADQQPNAYLAAKLGPMQPGYRGVSSIVFKGGRYGAMNPYPKPASFKGERALKGWDNDEPWYRERASITLSGLNDPYDGLWSYRVENSPDEDYSSAAYDHSAWEIGPGGFGSNIPPGSGLGLGTEVTQGLGRTIWLRRKVYYVGQLTIDVYHDDGAWLWVNGAPVSLTSLSVYHSRATVTISSASAVIALKVVDGVPSGSPNIFAGMSLQGSEVSLVGMNPAHIIYDSLTSVFMQGEPVETINEASFRAAADLFYSEGFGLCTEYSADQETVEEFRQRICNVVAARCSRSRVDGLWYLDPIRSDYDIDALPVLTDDDILEHEEQPSTLDDAVNQVTVQWFDTDLKESRTTAPMQALGAIMAAGAVNPELLQFPELAAESLANRVAARELHARATPLRRFKQVCNRTPYAWRIGTRFVIRAPRKGIEEMVCLVGDIDTGTLRSGAINLVAIQDAYGMPDATYLVAQPPQDTDNQTPQGSPQQRLVELPYVELVATLSRADMDALPPDVGYIGAIATAPRQGQSYSLYTHAAGEEFGEGSLGNWCPGATLNEAADYLTTDFTVAAQSSLALAEIGSRVLWELEECRLVAMDPEAGTISLARGCADTVPARHAAGTMLYFYDQWHAVDGREYADGETVSAKLLTRSGSRVQDPDEAPTLTHEIVGRAHRPYPPAVFRVNGEVAPAAASEAIELTWGHRDRVLQADQLVDNETAGLATPEPGTTYIVRWFLDGVADGEQTGITGTSATVEPSADGELRIEVWAVRDSLESYQAQVRELHYTLAPVELLETEASTLVETEAGDPISLE